MLYFITVIIFKFMMNPAFRAAFVVAGFNYFVSQ